MQCCSEIGSPFFITLKFSSPTIYAKFNLKVWIGGSRAAATTKMERHYHKALHLGCCSGPGSASGYGTVHLYERKIWNYQNANFDLRFLIKSREQLNSFLGKIPRIYLRKFSKIFFQITFP